MRHRNKPWVKQELAKYDDTLLFTKPREYSGKWREVFENELPVYLEVGTGKGHFVTTHAQNNPSINFIGFEVQQVVIYYAVKKAAEKELQNIAFINDDVKDITEIFGTGEVDKIYINFCDPWPKKKHAKRRLTHRNFLTKYKQVLKPEGIMEFKTDNSDLFEFSLAEFAEMGLKVWNVTRDLHKTQERGVDLPKEGIVLTEYEENFIKKGLSIYYLKAGFHPNL